MPYAGLCLFVWQEFSLSMLSQKYSGCPETKLSLLIIAFCTGKYWNIKIKLAFARLLKVVGIQLSHLFYSRTLRRLTFQSYEMRVIWSICWEHQHIKNTWFMWNLFYMFTHYNMTNIFNTHKILLCNLYINVHKLATSLGRIIITYVPTRSKLSHKTLYILFGIHPSSAR